MDSTAYYLWTFTWFVILNSLSGWKRLKKFIPRDFVNSPLIYILFSMFLNQFSFFTLIRKWVFATNYAFLTLLSSQPNVVDIRYIKLRILYLYEVSKIEISKAYIISLQRYRDEKIWLNSFTKNFRSNGTIHMI